MTWPFCLSEVLVPFPHRILNNLENKSSWNMTLKQSRCWSCRTTTSGMKLQNSSVNSFLHPSQTGSGSPAQAVPSEVPLGALGPIPSWLPPSTAAPGRAEGWHGAADGPSPPCLPMPEAWNAAGPTATWVTALPVTLQPWGSHPLLPEKPHRAAQAVAVGSFHPISSSMATWATPKWSQ